MKKTRLLLHHCADRTNAKVARRVVHCQANTRRTIFSNSISASFVSGSVIFARILASEGTAPAKAAPSGRVPLTQKADRSGIRVIAGNRKMRDGSCRAASLRQKA